MTLEISSEIKEKMLDVMGLYGYKSEQEFIEDALDRRILDLKKMEFLKGIKLIREKLAKKGLKEVDILRDFDKFYHQK